jgi:hypothetical protein
MEKYHQLAKELNEDIEDLNKLLEEKEYQALFADVMALDTYLQQEVFADLPQGDYHLKVEMQCNNYSFMKLVAFGLEGPQGYQNLISNRITNELDSLTNLYFKSFKKDIVGLALKNMLNQTEYNSFQLSKSDVERTPFKPDETYLSNEKVYHPIKISQHLPDVSFWLEFVNPLQHETVLKVQTMLVEENKELRKLKNIL